MRGRVQSAFPTCASLWQAELRTHLVPPRGRVGGRLPAVPGLRSVAAVSAASASGPVEGAGYSARAFIALRWGKFVCRAIERSEGRGMGRASLRGKGWGRCAAVLDAAVAGCAFATGREDLVRALIRAGPLV